MNSGQFSGRQKFMFAILVVTAVVAIVTALSLSDLNKKTDLVVSTSPLYMNLSWDSFIADADWIIIGTLKSHDDRYISVPDFAGEHDLYSNRYTVEVSKTLKGTHKEQLTISVLEDSKNVQLNVGDELLFALKETQPGHIVPIAKEYGFFNVKDGKVIGHFLKDDHDKNGEKLDNHSTIKSFPLETFVGDIKKELETK